MAFHWIPPPLGVLKINVHGIHSSVPRPNGNTTSIGGVYRDANGEFKLLTIGVVPGLSRIGNQLWAIYAPMRRAFIKGYRHVMIETDNHEAFQIIETLKLEHQRTCITWQIKLISSLITTLGPVPLTSSLQLIIELLALLQDLAWKWVTTSTRSNIQ